MHDSPRAAVKRILGTMRLEVDPVRLKDLRTRIGMPLEDAADKAKVDAIQLASWEKRSEPLEIEALRRLAKVYNRNWYVFLLEDEVGDPALPHDFRRLRSQQRKITAPTLIAFDNAGFLLQKINGLPRPEDSPQKLAAIRGADAEAAAKRIRNQLGASLDEQRRFGDEYATLRYWSKLLAGAGVYTAQMSFPYKEVRAFCLRQNGTQVIVVSSQDYPRARVFSMLHELAHVLLGSTAMCRPRPDDGGHSDEEAYCNAFAAAMLMPVHEFRNDPDVVAFRGRDVELTDLRPLGRKYGASALATARRLATVGMVSDETYLRLQSESDDAFSSDSSGGTGLRIRSQPARMINENSRLYATEVLDAHARGDITFRDIGVLLDGNLKHVEKVREELAK